MEKELQELTIEELLETKNYYLERKEYLSQKEEEYLKELEKEIKNRGV